ncbi:hypothetical protein [Candidatus Paracaedibacter symbiosus]|uniref:hypothetical protein n=1 Tax=Candidatus Paracaedibacter symbiosus TaxID=244582 RepID=UPI000509F771|nr:hypothetical protein [Candidatus Paracaedibacter symbiosus]
MKSDILLVSHHGSNSHHSTRLKDLEKIKPEVCIFSTGLDYSHPHQKVFEMLEQWASNTSPRYIVFQSKRGQREKEITHKSIFSTVNNGNITIDLNSTKKELEVERAIEGVVEFVINNFYTRFVIGGKLEDTASLNKWKDKKGRCIYYEREDNGIGELNIVGFSRGKNKPAYKLMLEAFKLPGAHSRRD